MTSEVGSRRRRANERNIDEMTTETETTDVLVNEEVGVRIDLNSRVQFPVTIPLGLRIELEQFAKTNGQAAGDIARKAIADAVGYKGSLGGKVVRQGMSEEEKQERQKARSAARTSMIKDMANRYGVTLGEGKKKKE